MMKGALSIAPSNSSYEDSNRPVSWLPRDSVNKQSAANTVRSSSALTGGYTSYRGYGKGVGKEDGGAGGWASAREGPSNSSQLSSSLYENVRSEVRTSRSEGLAPFFTQSSLKLDSLNDTSRYMEKLVHSARPALAAHELKVAQTQSRTNLQVVHPVVVRCG